MSLLQLGCHLVVLLVQHLDLPLEILDLGLSRSDDLLNLRLQNACGLELPSSPASR